MIDWLMSFPSEADGLAALAGTEYVNDGAWNQSTCFPGLVLVVTPAEYDAEGNQTQAQVNFPGFWVLLSSQDWRPEIAALEACRMAANREAAQAGEAFIYPQGLRADPAQIASIARIDGLPAGSSYPIQSPRVIGA